jgi:two-component system chemotaxis response regulator CheY
MSSPSRVDVTHWEAGLRTPRAGRAGAGSDPLTVFGNLAMKILLIDDSATMRNILKNLLTAALGGSAGADVTFEEAGDGVEGLSSLSVGGRFDLIMVDWNMPCMDGLTFVRKVRAIDKTTPVIMVTTEVERHRVVDAIQAGVNNYVIKPFAADLLTQKVRQTLGAAAKPAAV